MTNLINPLTRQPCEYVRTERGYVALRLSCTVTPAIQWFTLAQIEACNPVATCQEPPRALVVYMSPELAANVNHVIGVEIMVRKPAPVSLWAESMVA